MPADLREALASTFAGRYHVERELGRGGMATVYLVRDTRHDRLLALKVLHPELTAFLGRERFLREIAVASHLTHPNILPLHDSGEADGLLFFLMPYVEGETLRDRLAKEHPLPLDDALRIARDVAAALAYAHDHNIVHRDIKPSNILLQAGAAVVADFGIARAIRKSVDEDALTDSGLVLGTPAYMSPEQANAEGIDGRSDIYSLGCVLYEMLAGNPPFSAASGRTLLARHSLDPVPPLRTVRPSLPVSIERAVMKALEKEPADRFATAAEFSASLRFSDSYSAVAPPDTPPRRGIGRFAIMIGALLAASAALWFGWRRLVASGPLAAAAAVALDTSRYFVFPFARDTALTRFDPTQALQDAIARWQGVSVVDQFEVRDALARVRPGTLTGEQARQLAAGRGAGRFVRGELASAGDSLEVRAVLYDPASDPARPPLAEGRLRMARDAADADSLFGLLADQLLFRGTSPAERAGGRGTSSLAARQAFSAGQAALQQWALPRADSLFTSAGRHDPDYAQALLWTALVRAWSGRPVSAWRSAAERAAAARERLPGRDALISDAIATEARGDVPGACALWLRLANRYPNDFVPWYGAGDCQTRDNLVLPDRRSPTGWRFRTSYHTALRAYQRALQLFPSIHEGMSANTYQPVRRLFRLNATDLRRGVTAGSEPQLFGAYPAWRDDTLAFFPQLIRAGSFAESDPTLGEAIRHQRQLFHEIASAWVAALPESPTAAEALAFSTEILGLPGALELLQRARRLATKPDDRFRLAAQEVWLRVRLSAPADSAGLVAARRLADSLLQAPAAVPGQALIRASLAALTGRATAAAALAEDAIVRGHWSVPGPLAGTAPRTLMLAAMGGPADTLRELEARLQLAIERSLDAASRRQVALEWLARPATLAYPTLRFRSAPALTGQGDYLLDAMEALARGDTLRALAVRAQFGARRGDAARFAERPADALYPEAWLLAAAGDVPGAIGWLDNLLATLYGKALSAADNPVEAAPLVRAMALRAQLAARVGDRRAAARWARTVYLLWSDADPFLQPLVAEMRRLASSKEAA